ncbi:MAG: PIN domain-containing protein [Flavobacterium sp.]
MNGNLLIDTNIFIYLTKGDQKVIDYLQDRNICISFISELELLSFKGINEGEEQIIREILSQFTIIGFNGFLKETIINLRKKYNLKLPDSIILAIAKQYDLPFLTSDKNLKNIEEIDVIIYEL